MAKKNLTTLVQNLANICSTEEIGLCVLSASIKTKLNDSKKDDYFSKAPKAYQNKEMNSIYRALNKLQKHSKNEIQKEDLINKENENILKYFDKEQYNIANEAPLQEFHSVYDFFFQFVREKKSNEDIGLETGEAVKSGLNKTLFDEYSLESESHIKEEYRILIGSLSLKAGKLGIK